MIYRATFIFFVVFFVASCSPYEDNEKDTIYFSREDFKESTNLKGEPIFLDAGLSPFSFQVLKDTLVFVESLHPFPNYYNVYGLNSKKHLLGFATKGKGPYEFLSVDFKHDTNGKEYFSVEDISRHTATVYHIDSLLALKGDYIPERFLLPDAVKDYSLITKDSIIAFNDYYFKSQRIKNNVSLPIVRIDLNNPLPDEKYINNSKYFTANASGGSVAGNPKVGYFVAFHYEDKFEIYDKNLNLIKRLIGPDRIMPKYGLGEGNAVHTEKNKYHRAYYDIFLGSNAIFLLYVGYDGIPIDGRSIRKNVEVFKIGYDGGLLHRYQLDQLLIKFSFNTQETYLFGSETASSSDLAEHHLVKYKLDSK